MKAKARKALALFLCIVMLVGTMITAVSAASAGTSGNKGGTTSIDDVTDILNAISYSKYYAKYANVKKGEGTIVIPALNYDKDNTTAAVTEKDGHYGVDDALLIPEVGKVSWTFDVPSNALYTIEIEYCQNDGGKKTSIERAFYLNGEVPFSGARSVILTKTWKYDYVIENGKESFKHDGKEDSDERGNDIRPGMSADPKWTTYAISDANGYYNDPFQFYFKAGKNTITLEGSRESVVIKSIKLVPAEDNISYEEYRKLYTDNANGVIGKVEAENPVNVSHVTVYPVYDRTSCITSGLTGEQSAKVTKYNTIGGTQWQNVGEWVEYVVEVPKGAAGYYNIPVRYKQNLLSGMFVSRRVYIDGSVPFEEANYCNFNFSEDWEVRNLGNGDTDYQFYLSEGKHVIRLEVVLGDMGQQIEQVSESLTVINNCYLEILKLTGSTPDEDRTYGFSRVMPDVITSLLEESIRLKGVYNYLTEKTGLKGQQTATLEQIFNLLHKMASDETEIAKNLETLKSQIGNLGTWVNTAKTQPLQVDYIQVQSPSEEAPKSEGNFFQSLWYEIKLFFYSFIVDYNALGDSDKVGGEPVEVWITTVANTTGRDQAQIVRTLIENEFTPKTGINANIKLVASGTLLPSVLAGVGPDVSLYEGSTSIIDYAIRGAAMPLNEFVKQDPDVLSRFPAAAVEPLTLYSYTHDEDTDTYLKEEILYGLPDKMDFSMMFYRKDILSDLGLEIPKTWDDLLAMIPVLQYNNMEIGIQKDIYTFIHQSNNVVYDNGGMEINFDNTGVLKAFTKLCNMFTQYSLPYQYDFANRFRTGEMPIGIASYGMCNQLEVFATEISGLWGFVPLPGYAYTDDNGNIVEINNTSNAGVSGCLMLRGCDNPSNAWEFMKWYTDKDYQAEYSNEIVALMGISARPLIANIEAIYELPWTNEEAANISAQMQNLKGVPSHPGSYYLQRYIDFAFLAAYNNGVDPADAMLSYVNTINKELTRKRNEFNYVTMDYIEELGYDTLEQFEWANSKKITVKSYRDYLK
ncbi:MAG: extracellular solute-binding protein [Clostridia bacterium]|nr:extracellular solute-binding protein [Clostridia bacterium]